MAQGFTKLIPTENVYDKNMVLLDILRFKNKPSEMVRRLMLATVGADKLINMSCKRKKRTVVPEHVRNAVYSKHQFCLIIDKNKCLRFKYFYYQGFVKRKTTEPAFNMAQFIKIINNQCTTLRHPKKKEINQVKENHQRKHGQNSKAIEGQERKRS